MTKIKLTILIILSLCVFSISSCQGELFTSNEDTSNSQESQGKTESDSFVSAEESAISEEESSESLVSLPFIQLD